MNLSQRLRQLAASTGLDGFAHELRAIADEMEAQPADVTDEQILEATLHIPYPREDAFGDEWQQYEIAVARAILALRPVQVPMTEGWTDSAMRLADAYADACFDQGLNQRIEDPSPEAKREKLLEHLRHHAIKKEQA